MQHSGRPPAIVVFEVVDAPVSPRLGVVFLVMPAARVARARQRARVAVDAQLHAWDRPCIRAMQHLPYTSCAQRPRHVALLFLVFVADIDIAGCRVDCPPPSGVSSAARVGDCAFVQRHAMRLRLVRRTFAVHVVGQVLDARWEPVRVRQQLALIGPRRSRPRVCAAHTVLTACRAPSDVACCCYNRMASTHL